MIKPKHALRALAEWLATTLRALVLAAVIAALAFVAGLAHGQTNQVFVSVGSLVDQIRAGNAQPVGVYLMGVSDAGQGLIHCSPDDTTSADTLRLVGPVLLASDRNASAARVILQALAATWPCTPAPGKEL